MAILVKRPYCDSFHTSKTTEGKVSNALAKIGAFVDGALQQKVTGRECKENQEIIIYLNNNYE